MKNTKIWFLLLVASLTSIAQNTIKESHSFTMNGSVETLQVAAGGMLLVGTSDGLTGIEAHNKNVIYEYKGLGKIKTEELTILDNLPYVVLTRGNFKVILNYLTGKELFNSSKSGWILLNGVFSDFETQRIYVLGLNKQGYSIVALDMSTLEVKTSIAFNDKKKMGGHIDITKYYESNGKLFVRTEKGIVCIDKNTFSVEWAYDDLDKAFPFIKVLADPSKGLFFVTESDGNKSNLHKIDKNGSRVGKKPTKLEANTTALTFTPQGLLVQMMDVKNSYFQMYNIQTAEKIWEKPAEIKGSIFKTELANSYFLYASNSGLINSLDLSTGKTQLKKEIKTGPDFRNLILLENDLVFYITSTNMGIAHLKTGEYVKEPVKFKKASNMLVAFDEKNDRYVVSSGTELFFIKEDGNITKIKDLDFKEDETPSKIEFREKGILVGAKQNNLMIDYSGKVIYESYYKAPGQSLAAKIALGALTVAAASQSFNQNMAGNTKDARQSAQASTGMAGEFSKRFSATKETKDFLYILTKLDEGVGLIKLKKDTGEKVAELILKDKKPEYEVDELFGILYFKKDKKLIVSYDLR